MNFYNFFSSLSVSYVAKLNLNNITAALFVDKYKCWSFSYLIFSLLDPNIFNTLFSNTLNLLTLFPQGKIPSYTPTQNNRQNITAHQRSSPCPLGLFLEFTEVIEVFILTILRVYISADQFSFVDSRGAS
jgi:hypothetical protein